MLDLTPDSSSPRQITSRSLIAALLIHLLVVGFEIAATRSARQPTPPTGYNRAPVEVGPPPERFQHVPLLGQVPPVIPPVDPRLRISFVAGPKRLAD